MQRSSYGRSGRGSWVKWNCAECNSARALLVVSRMPDTYGMSNALDDSINHGPPLKLRLIFLNLPFGGERTLVVISVLFGDGKRSL